LACGDGSLSVRSDGGTYFILNSTSSPLFDVAWSFTNDITLAATHDDGIIVVFHLHEKSHIFLYKGHIGNAHPIAFSPSNN
jgi:hypothetical protein